MLIDVHLPSVITTKDQTTCMCPNAVDQRYSLPLLHELFIKGMIFSVMS